MMIEPSRRTQTIILEREKNPFQQMVDERLALAEQARQCAARPDAEPEPSEETEDDGAFVDLDSKLVGLHLEGMASALDETRKQGERTLRRMQQVMVRVQRGQQEALAMLRRSLDEMTSLEVVPPRVVTDAERDGILASMVELHGSEIPPDGVVYRLYREDQKTSFFVLSDGRVLALPDGTIGTAEDKDELISLVMNELHAREAVFAQGVDDLKATLDGMKQGFVNQLNVLSVTLTMQRV